MLLADLTGEGDPPEGNRLSPHIEGWASCWPGSTTGPGRLRPPCAGLPGTGGPRIIALAPHQIAPFSEHAAEREIELE